MAVRSGQSTAEASWTDVNTGSELFLADTTRVPDLPGFIKKRVNISPDESGILVSKGSVIGELGSGPAVVGWSVLGWGSGDREVIRVHHRPFRLRMYLSSLLSKGYENLDAVLHVTASVSSNSLLFSTVLRKRARLTSGQLAAMIAAGIDDLLQVKVAQIDGQALRHDRETQHSLMDELAPHLRTALEERGLRLEAVDLLAFNNAEESEELLSEISDIDRMIQEGVKPGREDVQRLLERLKSTGLATPEMLERAQLLYDGGTTEAFFSVMRDISRASRRRIEAAAADKSEQLSEKLDIDEETKSLIFPSGFENLLKFVGPACAIIGLLYRIAPNLVGAWWVLGAGVVAAAVSMGSFFLVRIQRLRKKQNQTEVVIRLDRWAKRNSLATDEMVRRQMGRELTNALNDVNDAKLKAFKEERKEVTELLAALENQMDLMRTEVQSAAAASTIVSEKGFPTQRTVRMVEFEEEMLRHARNLSIRSQAAKESLDLADVDALRMGLEQFRRTFSKRMGFLEGFKEL